MKGVKLLFTVLLCLVTGGAWAQYVYKEGDGNTYSWDTSDGISVNGVAAAYSYYIIDKTRGLRFFLPSPFSDEVCYVGLTKKTNDNHTDSVNIPSTITLTYSGTTNGVTSSYTRTKKVTAIIDYGFTTDANGNIPSYTYTYPDGTTKSIDPYSERKNYYNPWIKKVTFTNPSEMRVIGKSAFQGCTELESIIIPNSVSEIGSEAFTYCLKMKEVEFQTTDTKDANGNYTVKFTTLPANCFYQCNNLESLDIPSGVTTIGNWAVQDCWKLKSISIPNTVTTIGAHFLCRALSLTSFYIPASVTSIDGAFMHGCENTRDVYLLGEAANLKVTYTKDNNSSGTFENEETTTSPNVSGVNNCTFHIEKALADSYTNGSSSTKAWLEVYGGSNGTWGKNNTAQATKPTITRGTNYTYNRILWPTGENNPEQWGKNLGPNKWQSVIFYKDMSLTDFKTTFGANALAATFTGCHKDSESSNLYHLEFTTIEGSSATVPGKTPLMVFIPYNKEKYQINTDESNSEDWRLFYTQRYPVEVNVKVNGVENGDKAIMVGLAVPIPMHEKEFYFKWIANDNNAVGSNGASGHGVIRRSANAGDSSKGRFSCFWQIKKNGLTVNNAKVGAIDSFEMPDNTSTGITSVNKSESVDVNIYDMSGRLVGTSRSDLPRGMYIQGGKKFIKK